MGFGAQALLLDIRLFDSTSRLVGEKELRLDPRQRVVRFLNEGPFFGSDFSQVGGHLQISATGPFFVTSILTGPEFLSLLSAQPIEPFEEQPQMTAPRR